MTTNTPTPAPEPNLLTGSSALLAKVSTLRRERDELVEALRRQVKRCRTCNGTGGLTEEAGLGYYVSLECPDCHEDRQLISRIEARNAAQKEQG